MKTIGDIFKEKRNEKKLSLEEVERATKIRHKFLTALENGEYDKLPQATFTRGFVKNYSEFLNLSTNEMLALYRREYDETQDKKLLPKGLSETMDNEIVFVTPKRLTIFFIALLFLGFFIYLFNEYNQLAGAPMLMVTSPTENSVVTNKELEVTGKADADVTLKINNQTVSLRDSAFDQTVILTDGLNTITVTATGKRGKTTTIERHVRLLQNR